MSVTDQNWSSDPFQLTQRDGRLYGRGSCDMKGFIAATIAMAPVFAKAVRDRPLEMKIIEGHKGCFEYTTRFQGLEGHGSAPDLGVNAVEYATRYVAFLLELKDQLRVMAQVDWEMRPVQKPDADFVKAQLRSYCRGVLLPKMQAVFPDASIQTEVVGEVDGLVPALENEARQIVSALTGSNDAAVVPFGTEAGIFQNLGMDVVICGPGSIAQAHKADEYLECSQLEGCLLMLEKLAGRLSDT